MPKMNVKQTELTIEGSFKEIINFTRLLTKPYFSGARNERVCYNYEVCMYYIMSVVLNFLILCYNFMM